MKTRIKNINYLAVSNYESSSHSNCSNCVEVGLSHEDMISNLKEMLKVSYNHSNVDKGKLNYELFKANDALSIFVLVLAIYGFKYLGYDSKMSVLCFLHISSNSIVDECFNCCEGVLSSKLALYIYALRFALQFMHDIEFLKLPTDKVCSVFGYILEVYKY